VLRFHSDNKSIKSTSKKSRQSKKQKSRVSGFDLLSKEKD
jgi:hypothetical protein